MRSALHPLLRRYRQSIFLLIMFTLPIASCRHATEPAPPEQLAEPLPAMSMAWNDQSSIVCFGTSLTYGYGAGDRKFFFFSTYGGNGGGAYDPATADSSYPRFLKEALRIKVINQGYSGARSAYALSIVKDSILSKKPVLVLLEFGANEFLQRVSSRETDSVLSLLVQTIRQSGSQVVLLSFVHPDMTNYMAGGSWTADDAVRAREYSSMLTGLAARFSIPLIAYPLQGVFGRPALMSDQFHPNGAGYKKMEENIYRALIHTFEQNGMVK